jgi:signal transduction histidine kinase/DNA-binding response OmpR family regulator
VNTTYPDPDGHSVWFAGNDGLLCFDKTLKRKYDLDFKTLIRKVQLINDKALVFNGYKINTKNEAKSIYPTLDYNDRNLRIEFAAPFFEAEAATRYQYFLEGYDDRWSDWTSETKKDYTNIDAGFYTFRVRARNVYETLSKEASFQFKVLPPWYQTWWAYLIYAFFALLGVYFIVKWRSWKLVREKQRLEQVIRERTGEIKEKNLQLEQQSGKLKEMDQIKSRFFANISHEFRTPLTLIMGPIEQRLSLCRDKRQERELQMMLRNSQRLLGLINQLLDLSKLDSGKMKLQAALHNIVPFLKGLVGSFESLAAQKPLEIIFQTEEEKVFLYYDAEKLEKVICNLMANAVKFTPPKGKITVSVKQCNAVETDYPSGYLEISCRDTGIGIPALQLPYIFDRFYQADGSLADEHQQKGSGIGLALVKELVTLHHGDITVHSSEGKGTEFIIRLPLGKAHLNPDELCQSLEPGEDRESETQVYQNKPNEPYEVPRHDMIETGENRGEKPETDEPGEEEKDVLLVVDDSTDVRMFIKSSLEPFYTIEEAADGREGIDKARAIIPDLIVSDVMMPRVDGFALCQVLKTDIKTSHIPVILLTAKASEESIITGLETGADDYITKPFNTKILLTRIKNLIDLRRQLQEKIQREMVLQPTEMAVSSMDQQFMQELKKAVEKKMTDEEFGVDELAKSLYMSRATLNRKIRALTGESTNRFIQSYRLKRAAQLLKTNFGNVTEVAFEVGFSNSAYFTKCFKEKFHQLPHTFQSSESGN